MIPMNNKKNNRKGFTIVELVIVIAVIAILATVLVPTFGTIIKDAKNSALVQEIKNEHTTYTTKYAKSDDYTDNLYILIDGKYYQFKDGAVVVDGNDVPVAVTSIDNGTVYFDASNDELYTAPNGKNTTTDTGSDSSSGSN